MSWRFIFSCLFFCLVLIGFPLFGQTAAVSTSITVTVDDSDDDDDGGDVPAPSGGGGGGGGGSTPLLTTSVILQGKAYPNASLTILKDGQVVVLTKADSLADFKVTLTIITPGVYTFGIWAEDKDGIRSIIFSFTVTVANGVTTTVSGIFIPPTIGLNKGNVQQGEILNVYGQTAPESEIDVYIFSEEVAKKTKANQIGVWAYPLDTVILTEGFHTIKAKSTSNGLISTFSQTLSFSIGQSAIQEPIIIVEKADINGDNKVNLVDFSILLFNWGKPSSQVSNQAVDYNNDNQIDIIDFSIMMYYWTG